MFACEQPALFGQFEAAHDQLDEGFKSLQRADQVGSVGPRAAQVDVESVAILLGRELSVRSRCDEVPELASFATELSIGVGVLVEVYLQGILAVHLEGLRFLTSGKEYFFRHRHKLNIAREKNRGNVNSIG